MKRYRYRSGFSLIELLVVIAIISILMAMLLSVLSRVQEAGRRASCMSNLKQLSIALKTYSSEYEERFPPDLDKLYPAYFDELKLLMCPLTGNEAPRSEDISTGTDYEYRANLFESVEDVVILKDKKVNHGIGPKHALFTSGRVVMLKPKKKKKPEK